MRTLITRKYLNANISRSTVLAKLIYLACVHLSLTHCHSFICPDAFQKEITSADSNVAELLLSIMETCNTEVLENCLTLLVLLKDSSKLAMM